MAFPTNSTTASRRLAIRPAAAVALVATLGLALTGCAHKKVNRAAEVASTSVTSIGVNSYLWHASLDTLSFLPLASADPFGGVIISEWYVAPSSPNERLKVTIYIMDRALRADALKVVVFRQVANNGTWQDAQPSPDTAHKLEDSILTRARELRLATLGQAG